MSSVSNDVVRRKRIDDTLARQNFAAPSPPRPPVNPATYSFVSPPPLPWIHKEEAKKIASIPRLNEDPRSRWLTPGARWIRVWLMIRPGFLSAAERGALIAVARDGLVEHRVARRADGIVFLNDGWDCEGGGGGRLLGGDTVRGGV